MSSKILSVMALTAAAAFLSFVVHADDTQAVKGVWTKSSWSAGFVPSGNNVIYGLLPNPASGLSESEGSKSYDALTDGYAEPKIKNQTTCLDSYASLTYSLKAPCDIREVRVYSTWGDSGRDELSIDEIIAVKSTGEKVVLNSEGVRWDGGSAGGNCGFVSLKMGGGGALCTDVSKIVFKMGYHEYNRYIGYAELEVLSDEFKEVETSPVEIGPEGSVEITASPDEPILYGLNGGNLTISGADTVVAQNLTTDRTFAGINFSSYWPWIEGTVTVKDGATLTSNTMLFRGSGVQDGANENYREKTRLLIVQSGAKASFSPPARYVDIVGIRNGTHENASVLVEGEGSALTLPDKVYVGKKNDGDDPGHHAKVEIKNGGLLEAGTLYLGWNCSGFEFLVDGATVKALKGIRVFDGNARWTASTIFFKNCLVETPFYKCAHASSQSSGDTISFDGAVFRPVGEVNAKYFDTTPVAGKNRIVHTLSGNGLIIEAPEGSSLEVSGMFNGTGGFTKRGAGTVVLSANNEYTGTTKVESGKLEITGSLSGALAVSAGAEAVFSSVPVLPAMSIAEGGRVSVAGYGAEIGDVADYAGSFEITGVDAWPRNTALVKSNTAGFLEKIASELNNTVEVEEGYGFSIVEGSVQLVRQGITNGTIVWTGAGGDTSWSTEGNWSGQDRRLYSGDTLVVGNGGTSTVDFSEHIVLKSVLFNENIGSHTIVGASMSDTLKINNFVTNLSRTAQVVKVASSTDKAEFSVYAQGDVAFSNGLSNVGRDVSLLVKAGPGALVSKGGLPGFSVCLYEGALDLCGDGAALFSQPDGGEAVIVGGTALRNGAYTYQNAKDGYLPWQSGKVTVDNASLTTPKLFKEGGNRIEDCERRQLVITNNASVTVTQTPAYIISRDNGDGLDASGKVSDATPVEVKVLDNSSLKFTANKSELYVGMFNGFAAARNGRLDVVDSSIFGSDLKLGHRAGRSYFYATNSVVSFSSSIQLCPDAHGTSYDTNGIEVRFSNSIVTTSVFRVFATNPNDHFCYFDNTTLVSSGTREMFLEKKDGHDKGVIFIEDGGLKVVAPADKLTQINANANIEGTGGLTKLGEGILELASINTYAGATVVAEGTLRLTGRVAGAIQVASGAALELPIPAEGAQVPEVSQLAMAEGSALRAVAPALPEGVERVDVLRSAGEISVPGGARDASGYVFYVASTASGNVLRYGRKPGFSVILR